MSDHRIPPTTEWTRAADARHTELGMGYCKGCGEMLPTKKGKPSKNRCWCKGECQDRYLAEKHGLGAHPCWIQNRDDFKCQACGCGTVNGEGDHIVPLGMVDRADPECWRFWTASNMNNKCHNCHRTKTIGDVRHINAARKGLIPFVRWANRHEYDPTRIIHTHKLVQPTDEAQRGLFT